MKTTDVQFEGMNGIDVIITERKKHFSQRNVIPEKAMLNSQVHKSLKNLLVSWRSRRANDISADALFLPSNGNPLEKSRLGHQLSQMGKKVWRDFQPYDKWYWFAAVRLIEIKI